jgi:hypothetical protein
MQFCLNFVENHIDALPAERYTEGRDKISKMRLFIEK